MSDRNIPYLPCATDVHCAVYAEGATGWEWREESPIVYEGYWRNLPEYSFTVVGNKFAFDAVAPSGQHCSGRVITAEGIHVDPWDTKLQGFLNKILHH